MRGCRLTDSAHIPLLKQCIPIPCRAASQQPHYRTENRLILELLTLCTKGTNPVYALNPSRTKMTSGRNGRHSTSAIGYVNPRIAAASRRTMVAVLCRFGLRTFDDPTLTVSPSISLISSGVKGGGCWLEVFAGSSANGAASSADATSDADGVPLPALTVPRAGSTSVVAISESRALSNLFRSPSAVTDILRRLGLEVLKNNNQLRTAQPRLNAAASLRARRTQLQLPSKCQLRSNVCRYFPRHRLLCRVRLCSSDQYCRVRFCCFSAHDCKIVNSRRAMLMWQRVALQMPCRSMRSDVKCMF